MPATGRRPRLTAIVAAAFAALAMANGLRLYFAGAGGVHEIYWRSDVRLASVFTWFALYIVTRNRLPLATASLLASVSLALVISLVPVPIPLRFTAATVLLAYGVNLLDQADERLSSGLLFLALVTAMTVFAIRDRPGESAAGLATIVVGCLAYLRWRRGVGPAPAPRA